MRRPTPARRTWGSPRRRASRPYVPPPACPTDLNQSGATDAADLAALLSNWGGTGTGDVNGSGTIDAADLAALLSAWGACP